MGILFYMGFPFHMGSPKHDMGFPLHMGIPCRDAILLQSPGHYIPALIR